MYIGVDIGGTKTSVVLGDEKANILKKAVFETGEKDSAIQRILDESKRLKSNEVQAIGISCGGPLDGKNGVILSPPNLPGWEKVNIVKILEDEFSCPAFLQNDADAGALAEWYFGNAKGYEHVIFLTFGTGFGAGLILNGRLYTGADNSAGEIGHVRLFEDGHIGYGKRGAIEGYCSGGGIAQYQMGSAKMLAKRAYAGDQKAVKLYKEIGENLGRSLAILVDILNPEIIIIGSIYTRAETLLRTSMTETLKKEALEQNLRNLEIKTSKLGESIGDVAAICVAVNGMEAMTDIVRERR